MKKIIALVVSLLLCVMCLTPVSAAVCNHDTSGQTLYRENDHPHNTYRRCKTCNKKVYTGSGYTLSDCNICSSGVVSMRWPTESLTITSLSGGQYSNTHTAIDILPITSGLNGDDVYAMYDGEILEYKFNATGGYTCHINHDNPNRASATASNAYIYSKYCHLVSNDGTSLPAKGDKVSAGELIGYMGNSGEVYGSYGPDYGSHLHFETRIKSTKFTSSTLWNYGTAVNPETYFYYVYPGTSARSIEIPVVEPVSASALMVDNEMEFNDAREYNDYSINYEIAPDMYINIEWVANMTIQECYDNSINADIIQYFMSAIDEMTETNDYYYSLYNKLSALFEMIK